MAGQCATLHAASFIVLAGLVTCSPSSTPAYETVKVFHVANDNVFGPMKKRIGPRETVSSKHQQMKVCPLYSHESFSYENDSPSADQGIHEEHRNGNEAHDEQLSYLRSKRILTRKSSLHSHLVRVQTTTAAEGVSSSMFPDPPREGTSVLRGLRTAITTLLRVATQEGRGGRCALALTFDAAFSPAVDMFLHSFMENLATSPPVSLVLLPDTADKNTSHRGEHLSTSQLLHSERLGQDACTHYVFLVQDSASLLRLLTSLFKNSLNLRARFILVTQSERSTIQQFLETSPVNKVVQLLLAIPSSSLVHGAPCLQLYTHAFFLGQRRTSLLNLGLWPRFHGDESTLLFPDKLRNFNGFKFRATTFNHPPVSIFEPQPDGSMSYDGLEIRLLNTLASALNFTSQILEPLDGEKWGRRLSDGNWTGAMGETMRSETDVSFANYFITSDRLRIIDMTDPYYIDYTCFITPKPKPLPQYSAVAWPFTGTVWAVILLTVLMDCPIVLLNGVLEPGKWFRTFGNAAFYVVGVFLNRSQPVVLIPSSSGLRVVVIASWVTAMVLAVAYTSSLIAFLTVPLQAPPVNTLEELLSSGLQWGVRDRGGWKEWFSNSLDPTSQKIAAGFEYVTGIEGGLARVLQGDFAFMNSGTFLRYLVASNYTNEVGEPRLHIAKQCFVPFRIGLGMPRFSIYTSRFNDVVSRVVEAGLVSQWFQELLMKAEKKQRKKWIQRGEETRSDPHVGKNMNLGLYQVQGPFYLLLLGWLTALTAQSLEIIFGKNRGRGTILTDFKTIN